MIFCKTSSLKISGKKLSFYREVLYSKSEGGLLVLRNFIKKHEANNLRSFWLNPEIDKLFSKFIANKEVFENCPNYFYAKPTEFDRSYCCFMWNKPPDEYTHELAYLIQYIRSQIEGRPIYHGLANNTNSCLQYRVCNHLTNQTVVHPHADFVEMFRKDPTGSHKFDPSRLQATLILSTPNKDYNGDGLVLTNNKDDEIVVGKSKIKSGDLLLWRYTNLHSVRNILTSNKQTGFMRIIYPTYDYSNIVSNKRTEIIGRLNQFLIKKDSII